MAGLQQAMPRALLNPQVALIRRSESSAWLAELLDAWNVDPDIIDDVRTSAAAPGSERIAAMLEEINELLEDGETDRAARLAADELPVAATLLETLLPGERFRRSANLRNNIAVVMTNCSFRLSNEWTGRDLKLELLEQAIGLATDSEDRVTIQQHLALAQAARAGSVFPVFPSDGPGSSYVPWDEVAKLVRAWQFRAAKVLLEQVRAGAIDWNTRAEIDLALVWVPEPRAWWANLSLCLGLVAGVVSLMIGQWLTPTWAAACVTVLLSPFLLTIIYSRGYRAAAAMFIPTGVGALLLGGYAIFQASQWGLAPVLWCLGAFILTLPITKLIGRSWAGRWNRR